MDITVVAACTNSKNDVIIGGKLVNKNINDDNTEIIEQIGFIVIKDKSDAKPAFFSNSAVIDKIVNFDDDTVICSGIDASEHSVAIMAKVNPYTAETIDYVMVGGPGEYVRHIDAIITKNDHIYASGTMFDGDREIAVICKFDRDLKPIHLVRIGGEANFVKVTTMTCDENNLFGVGTMIDNSNRVIGLVVSTDLDLGNFKSNAGNIIDGSLASVQGINVSIEDDMLMVLFLIIKGDDVSTINIRFDKMLNVIKSPIHDNYPEDMIEH